MANQPQDAPRQPDRTVLPISEPARQPITEIDFRQATPPARFEVEPPPGAPNVLVILLDNLGYSASKTFGGIINMPTLERLAATGLVYTDFHVNPLCSPTRMALLTGRNCHSVNMGSIAEMATAFPGQTAVLPKSAAPLAQILKHNGYNTAMFGKSHETTPWEVGPTGPFDRWPTGMGFERFYGNIGGESDMFNPSLHDNTTLVPPSTDPEFYYQTDVADQAVAWIKTQKSLTPEKPFFVYFAAAGTHSPVQVPEDWRDKYNGQFDMGWDKAREETLARQKKLGIVPPNTQLAPKPDLMKDWDELSADEKKVCIRHQEVFAAFAEVTDYEIGRVVQAVDEMGVLDNTLIIYITGDNGSTGNGGAIGYYNTFCSFNQAPETLQDQLDHLDDFGGPHSVMTPPIGWSIADNTPFTETQFNTGYGGITNGAVISWPTAIKARGEIRNQYHHVNDIAPTVLEAIGLPQPRIVDGFPQKPMEGASMLNSFDDAQAKSAHTVQYYEFAGNRGIYKDGWYATTQHKLPWEAKPRGPLNQDRWELYNTAEDFGCANDLAAQEPDKLTEMQATFLEEALKYNVLPLDDRFAERMVSSIAGRPDLMDGRTSLTVFPGMVGLKENAFIDVKNRSSSITADLEIPPSGASGVIVAQGGMHSGWSLYVKDNRPMFAYNFLGAVTTIAAEERLPSGPVTLVYDFAYDGGKPGAGGTGTLAVNRQTVATGRIERTIPFVFGVESADVGVNMYTPVTPDYAKGDNAFTGAIKRVRIDVEDPGTAGHLHHPDLDLVHHPRG
jgi:arylsulfatase A-like enzyme